MHLRLYNTLTKTKEEFLPIDWEPNNKIPQRKRRVRMYVCGPTVYDFAHIGNARPAIVFDVLFRLLRHIYGEKHVTYVRNITDVDDKINRRALEEGRSIRRIADETTRQYKRDVAALGCLKPSRQPRATNYIPRMTKFIQRLLDKNHAYRASGHVLFRVSSFPSYGKLSRQSQSKMRSGSRKEVAPFKENPLDFVLWKPSDNLTPGWSSDWGRGRPGWHIECSAMSERWLGNTLDIHGGGLDLVFPHHENEIAQSESAHRGLPYSRVWMHNNFLNFHGEKMSKSLGNIVTIRELLGQHHGSVLRHCMLEAHYRQLLDWTSEGVDRARRELHEWATLISNYGISDDSPELSELDLDEEFIGALSEDVNTPLAIAVLRRLYDKARTDRGAAFALLKNASFIGLRDLTKPGAFEITVAAFVPQDQDEVFQEKYIDIRSFRALSANGMLQEASTYISSLKQVGIDIRLDKLGRAQISFSGSDSEELRIMNLIAARDAARKAKDFRESDRIRDELLAQGIVLKDGPDGTSWEVKK